MTKQDCEWQAPCPKRPLNGGSHDVLYMVHVPQVGDGLTVVSESGINDSGPILRPALPMGERQHPHRQQIPLWLQTQGFRTAHSLYLTEGGRIIMINVHLLPLI